MTEDGAAATDGTGEAVPADRDDAGVLALTVNRPERRNGRAEDLQEAHDARLAGQGRAPDLLLSACPFDDVLAAAAAYARDLGLHRTPRVVAVIASQVLDDQDASSNEAPARSSDHVDRSTGSAGLREGVASFVERRPPRFAPLGPFPD
ncbi:MAG TPA: hypothetical protein VD903_01555 [Pseudonocardia sp.]|nr:hypothetical protein [Pseudonocardia sp.]